MYDRILVPTDGSTGADAAADHAIRVARAFDSELHVLSVVDESAYSALLADLDIAVSEQRDRLEGRASEHVARIEDRVAGDDLPCETAVAVGQPAETILDYATDRGIDLISMGTHGRRGLDRLLMGSVTEQVLRQSDVPVLTSRVDQPSDGLNGVLIPTDGSDPARAAIEHGVAIADRFGATVHAISVVDVTAFAGVADIGPVLPRVIENLETIAHNAVRDVDSAAEETGVEVITHVAEGTPYLAIREYVESNDIGMIAMGTHGRSGVERYLLGSVTERTVRTSEVPVLTVR